MTAWVTRTVVLLFVGVACVTPAEANWIHAAARHVVVETKRRQCWPRPFVCPDRNDARAPFAIMVHNGWRMQNMLGDYHFSAEKGELTDAGRRKIRWIVTEAPHQHRTIYVHRGDTPELTAARINQTLELAAQLVPQGQLPRVLETDVPSRGWPASQVDIISRKYSASTPDPRLPKATAGASE